MLIGGPLLSLSLQACATAGPDEDGAASRAARLVADTGSEAGAGAGSATGGIGGEGAGNFSETAGAPDTLLGDGGGISGGAAGQNAGGSTPISCPSGTFDVVGRSGCFECPGYVFPAYSSSCGALGDPSLHYFDAATHKLYLRMADGMPSPRLDSGFAFWSAWFDDDNTDPYACMRSPTYSVDGPYFVLDFTPYLSCPHPLMGLDLRSFVANYACGSSLDAATNVELQYYDGKWHLFTECYSDETALPIEFGNLVPYPKPAQFDVSSPGVVKDNVTGLTWEHRTTPVFGYYYTQSGAMAHCDDLEYAGFDDWRLPSAYELFSLLKSDSDVYNFLDANAFPNNTGAWYWSATTYEATPWLSLAVSIFPTSAPEAGDGPVTIFPDIPDYEFDARCVRGGRSFTSRYTDLGDGTVRDNRSGLVWEQAPSQGSLTPREAQAYCRSLSLAGGGWRVPTITEVVGLSDNPQGYPSLDVAFESPSGSLPSAQWSSTRYVYPGTWQDTAGWYLASDGIAHVAFRDVWSITQQADVRCVR